MQLDASDSVVITYEVEITLTDVEDGFDDDEIETYRYGAVRLPSSATTTANEFLEDIGRFPLENHPWDDGYWNDFAVWDHHVAEKVLPLLIGDGGDYDIVTDCLDAEVFAAVNLRSDIGVRWVPGDDWDDEMIAGAESRLTDTTSFGWPEGLADLHTEVKLVETDTFAGTGANCKKARCHEHVPNYIYDCDGVEQTSDYESQIAKSTFQVDVPNDRPDEGDWIAGHRETKHDFCGPTRSRGRRSNDPLTSGSISRTD